MRLKLPNHLHYPITVTGLLKQPEDEVERASPLFSYTYTATATGTNEDGTNFEYPHTYSMRFEASLDGTLKQWLVRKGDVIAEPREVAEIDEPCTHSVQFGGMCVNCGKDMTQMSYASVQVDASRANINMIHDNTSLTVSQDEATKIETEAKRRLIGARKLSLVVDLDQTIIHATVDPTVAEWQRDPENPNYEAVKDVRAFQLVDDGPGGRGTWYYIKLRPGLKDFLENVAKRYELHIYTMGTRAYAQNIANLIDPERRIFGDRILSRDESGSMVAKNLQRLFPVDTKMVVIIDDRGDVWNWTPNLIKVTQFSFFIGIGDINSSFLPKRPRAPPIAKDADKIGPKVVKDGVEATESAAVAELAANGKTNEEGGPPAQSLDANVSALEQLVSMGGGDDPNVLQEQNAKQDEVLTAQLQERPLLQKQKELEAEEESDSDSEKPRQHLLNDDDHELYFLERSLKRVHTEFFDVYSRKVADVSGGRLAELRGASGTAKRKVPSHDLDLEVIPDIKTVLPAVKARVLAGVTIVFSGVIPLGTDPNSAEIVIWAKSFGARVSDVVSRRHTTHVVAARNRTAKVRQAVRRGKGAIKVVSLHWLMDCIVQWEKLEEDPYMLSTDEADLGKPFPDEQDDEEVLSQSESQGSGAEETDADTGTETEPLDSVDRNNPSAIGVPRLSVRTIMADDTDDEEFEKLKPGAVLDELSPVGGSGADWSEMNKEMKEFLGSSDDDDETDVDEDISAIRPHGAGQDDDEDEEAEEFDTDSRPPPSEPVLNGTRLHPSSAATTGKRSHADMTGSDSEASVASDRSGKRTAGRKKKRGGSGLSRTPSRTGAENGENTENVEEDDDGGWDDLDEAELEKELMEGDEEE